jgi:hypothetical protein
MSRWVLRLFSSSALVCLLAAHAGAQPADTVTRDAARSLGLAGVEAYQAGDFDAASDKLDKAYSIMNVPSLGLWSARARAKRNLLLEAASRYLEVTGLQLPQGDAAVQRQAQIDAQTELEQLRPQIPRLIIRVSGGSPAEVTLSIDGQAVASSIIGKPRLINPGSHRIEAQLAAVRQSQTVDLEPGKEASVELDLAPAPAPPPVAGAPVLTAPPAGKPNSTRRTLGWVGVGAGTAGIALGAVMGALSISKRQSLKDDGCSDTRCPHDKQTQVDRLNTFRVVSTIGFIAGGVLATSGIVLLITAPSNEHQLAAVVSGNALSMTGRF